MKKQYLTYMLFFALAYLGYDAYSYFMSDDSELGMEKARVKQLETDLEQKNKKVKESQEFYRTLESKRAELRSISQQLATMKSTLSENADIPGVMKVILSEAKRLGINVTGITPQVQVKKTYYVEQPFELTFQCVFVQLIAFMDRLSQAENIIRVDDFTIKPKSTNQSRAKYIEIDGTLNLKTFYYLGTREDTLATDKSGAAAKVGGGA